MFHPLPHDLKVKLNRITSIHKNGDYIQNDPETISIIEELQDAGYLKNFKRYLGSSYGVNFTFEDKNYDFLEAEYNKQFSAVNHIQIHNNSGQVNVASDHATIHATQNNGLDVDKLDKLITQIIEAAPKDNPEQLEVITELLEEIKTQAMSQNPKKGLLKSIFNSLKLISGGISFASSVASLSEFLQTTGIF